MAKLCEIVQKLRDKGMTYEEIGDILGVSKQAAHQSVNPEPRDGFRKSTIAKIKYVGLRNWMLERRINLADLERLCGDRRLSSCLIREHEPNKRIIDAILAATGLTYEECFQEESEEDIGDAS